MKKITRVFALLIVATFFAAAQSKAQEIIVRERPIHRGPVIVRPVAPSPRHVWVAEEWTPAGSAYTYRAGYWALPPRPRAVWIAGHWGHRPGGYAWIPGHWR